MKTSHLTAEIIQVMRCHADLSALGWRFSKSIELENDGPTFIENRERMIGEEFEQQVSDSIAYIQQHGVRKGGSYSLKHKAERAAGRYISNGAFICAALVAGYEAKREFCSPNCTFKTPGRGKK